MPRCKHTRWYWTAWTNIQGVTRPMRYRDKICSDCGARLKRETKDD
jgi:hypothetical protein